MSRNGVVVEAEAMLRLAVLMLVVSYEYNEEVYSIKSMGPKNG